jgi:hypothetical protein
MFFDVFRDTIMITSFVLVIMLVIEYINVQSHGNWLKKFENKRWAQYLIAGLLAIVPGCVGTFGIVSMYIHNMISFGALVTALLATFGDEAFVMFAMMPLTTIKLTLIIFALGIVVGVIVDLFVKDVRLAPQLKSHFEIHHSDAHSKTFDFSIIKQNVTHLSFPRATLLGGLILILLGIVTGQFHESHNHGAGGISWEQISFFVFMLIGLFIIVRVSDHFLEEHLWQHLVKKHFLKIFLWTFGALLFIGIFQTYLHIDEWIKSNQLIILLLAVVIGIIPESGPHLIFVTLFMSGAIPFTTLLASSIVQDGHGALPLLAESKKSFFLAKGINIIVGLLVGIIGLYII